MMEKEKRKKKINMFLYETEISCSRLSVRDGASYLDDNMILQIRHLLPFQPSGIFYAGQSGGSIQSRGNAPSRAARARARHDGRAASAGLNSAHFNAYLNLE